MKLRKSKPVELGVLEILMVKSHDLLVLLD